MDSQNFRKECQCQKFDGMKKMKVSTDEKMGPTQIKKISIHTQQAKQKKKTFCSFVKVLIG